MNYEGQICRSPMERGSYMLPVVVGCIYNQCKFCTLFKHLKYREIPFEQVKEEVLRVKNIGGSPSRVFLGDGSAFALSTDKLLRITDLLHENFFEIEEINMDATVPSILSKSDSELKSLYNAGIRHLYLGIECALDETLDFMHKDHNVSEALEAVERIKEQGMIFDAHIMSGVCGKDKGIENAHSLAEFFNKTKPSRIVNFSMFLHTEAPLYKEIENKNFFPASEWDNLNESYELIKNINDFSVYYDGMHDYIPVRVRGNLSTDKSRMLIEYEKAMESYTDEKEVYSFVEGTY